MTDASVADRERVNAAKQEVRQRIWEILDARGAVQPPGAAGHIPSFVGAAQAAGQLEQLDAWEGAHVVKANPDTAQLPVRMRALAAAKLVYMAVPRLASRHPFFELDPARLSDPDQQERAATSRGAAQLVARVTLAQMRPVDLIVCGSVAVDRRGVRLGKGAGYSDIEVALLHDAGLITPATTIVTTVHELQIVDELLPEDEHDFRVDYIVTPERVIECPASRPFTGIDWERLTPAQLRDIPVLTSLRERQSDG